MSDQCSRALTIASGVVAILLVANAAMILLDDRPVGTRDSPVHCGNAFWDGPDSDTATLLCSYHQFFGRLIGSGALLLTLVVVGADAWRRSRRAGNARHQLQADPIP